MNYARLDKYGNASQNLDDHLNGVADNIDYGLFTGINFSHFDSSMIREQVAYMGYYHDLGKYTDYFQDYLLHGKDSPYSDHAHISAVYLYQNLRHKLKIKDYKEINNVLAFLLYTCVGQHHGNLNMSKYCRKDYFIDAMEKLQVQADNLLGKTQEIFQESSIAKYTDIAFFKECCGIKTCLLEFKLYLMHRYIISRLKSDEWYFLLIYLFSLLIDSDKIDSAGAVKKLINPLPVNAVDKYINNKDKGQKSINHKRKAARREVKEKLQSLSEEDIKNNKFFTLTAPTGLGKTLLSMECALELQQRIHELEGHIPRIITAIPFINIIEQSNMVYREMLGEKVNIIVHHRLADYGKQVAAPENIPLDRTLLEVEAWEGEVILTTFVQLFHSILSGRNRALKKLNKLAGSIIILDEVQAIPEEYLPLLGATLIKIAEYYGIRFILMTATQPRLLQAGYKLLNEELDAQMDIELLPGHRCYFDNLARTEFIPMLENTIENDEFVELVLDKWNYSGSVLIVVNTIKRSIDIFNSLKNRVKKVLPENHIGYLSTNIIPLKRKAVIQAAKEILKPKEMNGKIYPSKAPYIMVSTQTIEAGVDLDFDMAFRDLAPLESLVQSAGRVNRENLKEKHRPVYLVKFKNDSSNVYKLSDINVTGEFLTGYERIKEHEYQARIDTYYENRLNRPLPDKSKKIWGEGIIQLDFDIIDEFELIKNTGDITDVFVEIDDYASKLADAYEEMVLNKDVLDISKLRGIIEDKYLIDVAEHELSYQERKVLLKIIQAKMNNYVISIRHSRLSKNIPPKFSDRNGVLSNMLFVPKLQVQDYYDQKTGFKDESGGAYIF